MFVGTLVFATNEVISSENTSSLEEKEMPVLIYDYDNDYFDVVDDGTCVTHVHITIDGVSQYVIDSSGC